MGRKITTEQINKMAGRKSGIKNESYKENKFVQ
jgi:hypothetical protein